MMKHLAFFFMLLAVDGCSPLNLKSNRGLPSPDEVQLHALKGLDRRFTHLTPRSDLAAGQSVNVGERLGRVQEPPADKYHEKIIKADSLYYSGNYAAAKQSIEAVYQQEPDNLFAIELYARVLFRVEERSKSFELYTDLMRKLDGGVTKEFVNVDMWFIDAYAKLGALYLDRREVGRAAYQISRRVVGGVPSKEFEANTAPLGMD